MMSLSTRHSSKILTLLFCLLANYAPQAAASLITEQSFNTHLRWNIYVPKEQLLITKTGNGFFLETLNLQLFKKIQNSLKKIQLREDYFTNLSSSSKDFPEKAAQIRIDLKDNAVELFSFYRSKDKKYVLDFWKSDTDDEKKISQVVIPETKIKKVKGAGVSTSKKTANKVASKKKFSIEKSIKNIKRGITKTKKQVVKKDKEYRDYRYGASLVWDYKALSPRVQEIINLQRKTPEYFYPIKDRNLEKAGEDEAHMQLTINLYRKRKFGLMAKSIRLYDKKYGVDKNYDLNDYLKACAIIRENLNNTDKKPIKSAVTILSNIVDRSQEYEMRRGILNYMLQYSLNENSYLESLQTAKRLYVYSKTEFDRETSDVAAGYIFYSLAALKQVEKIKQFSSEPSVQKLVSAQTLLAYEIYVLLKENRGEDVIKLYESKAKGLQKPIEGSILYNVAEAYFRKSKYTEAIKLFDTYLKDNSHTSHASFARVRLALSYEITERETSKVVELYKNAINRSSDPKARYEAKLRYVALRVARKIKPTVEDLEVLSFLDYDDDEKVVIDNDLKQLLWLVRMRSLVNQEKFKDALAYLATIPIKTFKPVERRLFEGDGAEIVYGLIKQTFEQFEYSRSVKLWEIYRSLYEDKVAGDPYLNFIIAQSYVNLGLTDGVDRTLANLNRIKESPTRTFPIWSPRIKFKSVKSLVEEVEIAKMIRKKNWDEVVKVIEKMSVGADRKLFYLTVAHYKLKNHKRAIANAELFLRVTPDSLPLNKIEVANFFDSYIEALFAEGKTTQFDKVANALMADIGEGSDSKSPLYKLEEKVRYLYIESLSNRKTQDGDLLVESEVKRFLKDYDQSEYSSRLSYLLANSLVSLKKKEEGLKIYEQLVSDETTAVYLKEMSKTQITALKLDEKIVN